MRRRKNVRMDWMTLNMVSRCLLALMVASFAFLLSSPCPGKTLEARVEHTDKLPTVAPDLMEGHIFDESALPARPAHYEWHRVPKWMAGSWAREMQTNYRADGSISSTFACRSRDRCGYQMDAKGRIWEPAIVPFRSKIETSDCYEYAIMQRADPVLIARDACVFMSRSTRVRVDKRTGKIIKTFQQEDLGTYAPLPNGGIEITGDMQAFDQEGRPLRGLRQRCRVVPRFLGPYQQIDFANGFDFKSDFISFLRRTNQTDLIPQR